MEERLGRALVAWVDGVRRRARSIVAATAATTLVLLAYAALNLGVNTSHKAILSDDLPFWKEYNAFAEVFPILDEAILVVVDAEDPSTARDATLALAERLAREPERYEDVYVPGGDPFFERNALLYLDLEELEDLSDQLAGMQPLMAEISRDRSLARMATVLREGIERLRTDPDTPMDFTKVFDSWSRAVRAVLEGRPRPISWIELILERDLPGESSRRVIVVQPVLDYERLVPGREAIQGIREAAHELGLGREQGVRVRVTGNVALNTEEMVSLARGTIGAALGSLVLVALILTMAMRSAHLVASAFLTLIVSLVWTAAFAALAVGHVNVVSVSFAVLVIGLGIDFGLHFGMRYGELLRAGEAHEAALEDGARSVGGSLVLCALTTSMAFFVFVPTDYKAAGELGLIAGTGMLVSLWSSLTVLPALLTVWRERHPGTAWPGAVWLERVLITASAHHPGVVRWGAAILAALSLVVVLGSWPTSPRPDWLPRVRFDHNVVALRDPSTESVQTFNELLDDAERSPWTMDVMAAGLDDAVARAGRIRELDVVERAVTLADYVPDEQEAKLGVLEDLAYFLPEPPSAEPPIGTVPLENQVETLRALQESLRSPWLVEGDAKRAASAARAERYLGRFLDRLGAIERREKQEEELAEFEESLTGALPDQIRRLWRSLDPEEITLGALPAPLRERMVAPGGRARVEVLPREDLGDNEAHARFVDRVRALEPDATGSAVITLEFGRAVVRSFLEALAYAIVAVAVLLWLLWRRPGDMALVVAPLALALLLTTAQAGLLDIPFNFANVLVLPLLLGIGVDSGVHLVHRHRVTIETTGAAKPPERELLETSTAQAVFFSALTTMASFGSLALSSHLGFASLGKLLLLGVTNTLLANLIVLPALLAVRGGTD